MSIESGKEFVSLELTGPAGTREMIASLFGWNQGVEWYGDFTKI